MDELVALNEHRKDDSTKNTKLQLQMKQLFVTSMKHPCIYTRSNDGKDFSRKVLNGDFKEGGKRIFGPF